MVTAPLVVSNTAASAGHANPVLSADLDGRAEVGADGNNRLVGDPNGVGEAYVFGVVGDPDRNTLCYVLLADKIADIDAAPGAPFVAHIHEGQDGENEPPVVTLAWPQGGQSADCLSVGDTRIAAGTKPDDIFDNPENYYVNVHNAKYPAGAIRGQLDSR